MAVPAVLIVVDVDRRGRPKTVNQRKIIAEPLRPPQAEDLNAGPLPHALIPWHGDLFQNRCDSRIQPIPLKHNGDVAFCWHHGSVNTLQTFPWQGQNGICLSLPAASSIRNCQFR